MNHSDWKATVLKIVIGLLFLIDIGEFVVWKFHQLDAAWHP
jgi:hypothetical protein